MGKAPVSGPIHVHRRTPLSSARRPSPVTSSKSPPSRPPLSVRSAQSQPAPKSVTPTQTSWIPPQQVEHPQLLTSRLKFPCPPGAIAISGRRWSPPFRTKSSAGIWSVSWAANHWMEKPRGWQDIPTASRLEAAQLALEMFRDWILAPAQSIAREGVRKHLRGFNLACNCTSDWPCHGRILLTIANSPED
jgi:hypothetical protein